MAGRRGDRLLSRVALVTGASRGIGLATARRLAAEGLRVAATYRDRRPEGQDSLLWVPCDVTDPALVEAAFDQVEQELGPVEVLVSNAGITRDALTLRMSDEDFSAVLEANLTGSFRVARRAARRMIRSRWGRMVFLSSVVATGGQAGQANYAASKAGLIGLARSLARELASRQVTVNVLAPGPIETDMIAALDPKQRSAILAAVPLGRMGTPDEVASTIAFLCSEEAGYITGALIPIDGGLSMGT